jgi:hypothetical protein
MKTWKVTVWMIVSMAIAFIGFIGEDPLLIVFAGLMCCVLQFAED